MRVIPTFRDGSRQGKEAPKFLLLAQFFLPVILARRRLGDSSLFLFMTPGLNDASILHADTHGKITGRNFCSASLHKHFLLGLKTQYLHRLLLTITSWKR